jgi:expansin
MRKSVGALILVVCLTLTLASGPVAAGTQTPRAWLPLIAAAPNPNPVHNGIATYYTEANGDGACMFGPSPNDLLVAAMNAPEFNNAAVCGEYVHVKGARGEVTVRIVDLCPECLAGHLDLSPQAFALIDDLPKGRVSITWQVVSPALSGPIAYHFMDASNQWWTAVQVRNIRNPVARLEYKNGSGQWVSVPRTSYNYFVQTNPGMGLGPYTLRITDSYGNVLVDSGIAHTPGASQNGAAQFPPGW